jgi:hypothetical protein
VLPYLMAGRGASRVNSNEIEDLGPEGAKVGIVAADPGLETGYPEFGERWHDFYCQNRP